MMAEVTPAAITYTPVGQAQTVLRFHTVVSETHQAVSEITKFPVQSGFEISNNVIRKNRMLTIEGIITNTQLASSRTLYNYSETDNSKAVFEALESLVNTGTPCEVVTNLGRYNPVVFNKFSTKQAAGLVDSMHFSITGEELQIATNLNRAGPRVLSFVALSEEDTVTRALALKEAGFNVCNDATITEANVTLGEDFVIDGFNDLGQPTKTSYIQTGIDPTTGRYNYEVHTSVVEVYVPEAEAVLPEGGDIDSVPTSGGFSQVGDCLVDTGLAVLEEAATDLVDTAMGELAKTGYGALYDTVNLSDNDYGQELIHSGVGCMVRGIKDAIPENPFLPDGGLPNTTQIIQGAKEYGASLFNGDLEPVTDNEKEIDSLAKERPATTITQVQC